MTFFIDNAKLVYTNLNFCSCDEMYAPLSLV